MDSTPTTNRKSFLKRAGLAIAGVFAVSSTTGLNTRKNLARRSITATQGTPKSAIARVRKADGAIARKVKLLLDPMIFYDLQATRLF